MPVLPMVAKGSAKGLARSTASAAHCLSSQLHPQRMLAPCDRAGYRLYGKDRHSACSSACHVPRRHDCNTPAVQCALAMRSICRSRSTGDAPCQAWEQGTARGSHRVVVLQRLLAAQNDTPSDFRRCTKVDSARQFCGRSALLPGLEQLAVAQLAGYRRSLTVLPINENKQDVTRE